VATIGRNDPCPCQSGKKYKKCCLAADQARASEKLRADEQRNSVQRPEPAAVARALAPILALGDDDGLDDLSNSAVDLADGSRFDEALAVCARLLAEYPDDVDGLERSAMVHAKMGHHALAADFYRRAFDFVNDPGRRDDCEEHDYYREQAEEQRRLAGSV
jgi:tetratricopeptide (TPR) repeat protein